MNINHPGMMPEGIAEPCDERTWKALIDRREATFRGFAEIEAVKGFVQPTVSLHTPRGQDTVRLLSYRVIEELVESREAQDVRHEEAVAHRLEELIDAVNYLLCIPLLDSQTINRELLIHYCVLAEEQAESMRGGRQVGHLTRVIPHIEHRMTDPWFSDVVDQLVGPVGDALRNRAWTEQPQDIFFSQAKLMLDTVGNVLARIMACFPDWDTFYRYYIGKDNVLQFRLQSKY